MEFDRDAKAAARLTELAANYIAREAGRSTLITPTRTFFEGDHKRATIYITVYPESDAKNALAFMIRHRDDFRAFIKKEGRFKSLPFISFDLDAGEVHRRHLDELTKDLSIPEA